MRAGDVERDGLGPEIVHTDHHDDDVGPEHVEHFLVVREQPRRIGARITQIQDFDGRSRSLVLQGLELGGIRVPVALLQQYPIGIGISQAEDPATFGHPRSRNLGSTQPDGECSKLKDELEPEDHEGKTQGG